MKTGGALLLALAIGLASALLPVQAQGAGDSTRLSAATALTGEQLHLTIEVLAPDGSTVEPDPANPSWAGIEIVRITSSSAVDAGDATLHRLELVIAGFVPGERTFQPAVFVVAGAETSGRLLPRAELSIIPTLAPGDPLDVSPVPPPSGIDGAQSPLVWPAAVAGGLAAAGLATLAFWRAGRRLLARAPAPAAVPETPAPTLDTAEALLDRDPAGAYRTLAATVRETLGLRYGFPARALTTREMDRRMLAAGVGRWQARLVTGLLEECDAVVYAGYRPAPERRAADLTMAREIVEGG